MMGIEKNTNPIKAAKNMLAYKGIKININAQQQAQEAAKKLLQMIEEVQKCYY